MTQQYVSSVEIAVDGKKVDAKNFKELAMSIRGMVKLMKKRGFVKKTPDIQLSFDYPLPVANEIDFADDAYENVPVVVAKDGGGTINYSGCFVMDISEATYDDENEAVKTITWGAEKKDAK